MLEKNPKNRRVSVIYVQFVNQAAIVGLIQYRTELLITQTSLIIG